MSFTIHLDTSVWDDAAAERYRRVLCERFAKSPEAEALGGDEPLGWGDSARSSRSSSEARSERATAKG